MPSKISTERARAFCKALKTDTGGQPMRWRGIAPIATRARLEDGDAAAAVAIAVDQGWLELEGGHSVCLTEAGRKL